MTMKSTTLLVVGAACASLAVVSGAQTGDALPIPPRFDDWYLVNSMIVTKDSPQANAIGGLHHIYVNAIGLPRLKKGGTTPYPDGTVFADDLREFSLMDGSYVQGKRKAIPVMVKDSKRYASTGGWGFQAWATGDPQKPLVTDSVKACFQCHAPQKPNDYTFSTYLR